MVSPNLIKKGETSLTLNDRAKKIFQLLYGQQKKAEDKDLGDDVPKIKVSAVVSRLSFLYEKIRNAVDYEDENLLRKNAIKRIVKRQLFIEGVIKESSAEEMAVGLLTELIQAGYLPNNKVPETKISEVRDLLNKYIDLKKGFKKTSFLNFEENKKEREARNKMLEWLMGLLAAELDGIFDRNPIKKAAVLNLFEGLNKIIKLPPELPYENQLKIQIYLSLGRTFLKLDEDTLSLITFKYYTGWDEINANSEEMEATAKNLSNLHEAVLKQLNHPLKKQLDKITRKYALYYSILLELAAENPQKVYENTVSNYKGFINSVKEKCEEKYSKAKTKLWRSGIRSIIYIFLTKSIFVFILEIPVSKLFNEPVALLSLVINIAFPAFLLFIIILISSIPGEKNTKKIIDGVEEIVFLEKRRTSEITLRRPKKRAGLLNFIFNLVYAGFFLLAMYFLVLALDMLHFNWVSITIFMFFLAFVSFFSFRVKREIKELTITEDSDNILNFFLDLFYMPIVAIGKILSENVSKINVFVFVLDFIIEAPFKVIVGVIEDWSKYLKERKENLS